MIPNWKVAFGHLYEFLSITALIALLFVVTPIACGQRVLINRNGQMVEAPPLPLSNVQIDGCNTPTQFLSIDSLLHITCVAAPAVSTSALAPADPTIQINAQPIQEFKTSTAPLLTRWRDALLDASNQVVNVALFWAGGPHLKVPKKWVPISRF